MSQLIMAEGAAPSTPSTGKAAVYVDTNGRLAVKDDVGVVLPGGIVTSGSWTATIVGSTTAGAHTYSAQQAAYIRVGQLVYAWCRVGLTTKDGTMAGDARISGLPFAGSASSNNLQAITVGFWASLASTFVWVGGYISTNAAFITLTGITAAAATTSNLTAAHIQNGTLFIAAATYITEAI